MKIIIKRMVAYWLDFVILAMVLISLQWTLYTVLGGFPFEYLKKGYQIELWVLTSMSLPVWVYFILFEFTKRQTLGKRMLKLEVINEKGRNIKFSQALLRTFIKLLPWELTHLIILVPTPWWGAEEPVNTFLIWIPNLLLIVYVVFLFPSKGNKGVHDYLAQTRVQTALGHSFSKSKTNKSII